MNNFKKVCLASSLSYIAIILNSLSVLIIAPYIMNSIGPEQYGVFKLVTSVTTSLTVLDFGIGNTVTRFIARYDAEKEFNKKNVVYTFSLKLTICINILVFIIGILIYNPFISLYQKSLTLSEIHLAKVLYSIALFEIVIIITESVFGGFLAGSNLYIYLNSFKIISILVRSLCSYFGLLWNNSAIVLICVELITAFIRFLLCVLTVKSCTSLKWVKKCQDNEIEHALLHYSKYMFLDTIIGLVINNSDNVIIGAINGASFVTIYSFGLQIYSMFSSISTSISNVMLPVITKLVVENNPSSIIEDYIIRAGKIQYILIGGVECAFILFGKDFITLWLGIGYSDVWIITVVLMVSATIPFVENVTVSVLKAKNMMKFYIYAWSFQSLLNILLTIYFVNIYGYVAAAYTTGFVSLLISGLVINVYYYIKLELNVFRVLKDIFSKITLALIASFLISYFITRKIGTSWLLFVFKILIFVLCYLFNLLLYGLSKNDKKYYISKIMNK